MECKLEGCARPRRINSKVGYCEYHYRRQGRKSMTECSLEGCDRVTVGRGWCSMHWQRWKKTGDPASVSKNVVGVGSTRTNSNGYTLEYLPNHIQANSEGRVLQHRRVMSDYLGRKLKDYENVHHKNGVRTDNRLENLELWIVRQPYGQRVEDLLEWADWIIARYRDGK